MKTTVLRKELKPWQFLALVFSHLRRTRPVSVSFAELTLYANYLKKKYDVDVDWDHDNYNFCFGFYSPVFKEYKTKNVVRPVGVSCDYSKLRQFYESIVRNGSYAPKLREFRFIDKEIYEEE